MDPAEPNPEPVIPEVDDNGHTIATKPPAIVRRLVDLKRATKEDGNTLLGNRFLCRGGGALLVGASGIGKSTAALQMGSSWSIGRPCFGIKPSKPLKVLYVQAENDEGDLCEMRDGVFEHLGDRTSKEQRHLENNFVCVFESARAGEEFFEETLEPLLQEHSPDLVMIDPVLSYLGGDANEQKTVSPFLRNSLNPLLQQYRCGALILHHTNKQAGDRNNRKRVATDYAYAGSGSAEWANWARAVLVLDAKDDKGLRELRIGKRFRLGWKDAMGKPCAYKLLLQNPEGGSLFYHELSPEETIVQNQKLSPVERILRSQDILPENGEEIPQETLFARIRENKICGRDRTRDVVVLLVDQGYLIRKEVERPCKRPEIRYVRPEQKDNKASFAVPAT
jgi:hypothetical protein